VIPRPRKAISVALIIVFLLGIFVFSGAVFAVDSEQQSQFVAPKLVANTSFLNVRTGPGIEYSALITVVGGTELPVLGVAQDRVWYQVSTVVGVGWVNVEYTLPRGDFAAVPFADAPVGAQMVIQGNVASLGQGGGGAVPQGSAALPAVPVPSSNRMWGVSVLSGDLHVAPDVDSDKLYQAMGYDMATIYPVVSITGAMEYGLWFQFPYTGIGTGWTLSKDIFLRPLVCPGNQTSVVVITKETGVIGPAGWLAKVGDEYYAVKFNTRDQVEIEGFDGSRGWVSRDAVRGRDESSLTSVCSAGVASVPSVPVTAPGAISVVGSSPVVSAPASFAAPRVVINTGYLNVRSGPGAQYTVVSTVPGGTELPILGIASDDVWYLIQGTFGQGWINKEFVVIRGDMSKVPIIREAAGVLANPTAIVAATVTLYAAPNVSLGMVGAVSGPIEVPVVARSGDASWVQLNTPIGFGWVQAANVTLRGDLGLAPVIAQ
jgi:uncharacterized protein YraI